jgi:uncharacterized protein
VRFRLLPIDDAFFAMFNDVAVNVAECARRLRDLMADPGPSGPSIGPVIECERRGDDLTKAILQRLNTSFVTPFDREDIHELAEELDDVVDDMLAVAHRVELVGVTSAMPEIVEQAELIVQMGEQIVGLVSRLKSMKGVEPYLDAIDTLESQGDSTYRAALSRLFGGDYDAVDILRWKDMVEAMELAINTLEDVSNVVESIVLKHA